MSKVPGQPLIFMILSNVTSAPKEFIDKLEEHLNRIKAGIDINEYNKSKPCCGKLLKEAIADAKSQVK